MTIRTFVALEIPDEVLKKIIDIKNSSLSELPNVKWEPKEKLHLTLKFLGDINSELINFYSEMIQKIVAKYKRLELSLNKFGVFKRENQPKILWIGFNENKFLINLVNEIENAFNQFGFERDRKQFNSHITLLRFRGHEDSEKILSLLNVNIPKTEFSADKVTFFQSKLLPSGSIYKPLKSFYLSN